MKISKLKRGLKVSKRKTQMRLMEMSFMIIAIAIFFVLVLLFWLSITLSGLKENVSDKTREKSILLLAGLSESPEFNCPWQRTLCVDMDKILALKRNPIFKSFWGIDGLEVQKVYPHSNITKECNIENYPNCNRITIKNVTVKSYIADYSWVSLCRYSKENERQGGIKCELGKIVTYTEKK